jgi:hypothetical protein
MIARQRSTELQCATWQWLAQPVLPETKASRDKMPQLNDAKAFRSHLEKTMGAVTNERENASHLKAAKNRWWCRSAAMAAAISEQAGPR